MIKLRAIGNSQGVILPARERGQLQLNKDDLLSVSVIDGSLVLRPESIRTAKIIERSIGLFDRHSDALKGLGND